MKRREHRNQEAFKEQLQPPCFSALSAQLSVSSPVIRHKRHRAPESFSRNWTAAGSCSPDWQPPFKKNSSRIISNNLYKSEEVTFVCTASYTKNKALLQQHWQSQENSSAPLVGIEQPSTVLGRVLHGGTLSTPRVGRISSISLPVLAKTFLI